MAKKNAWCLMLGILFVAGALLAGCGDKDTGDPSGAQGDGDPGYVAILNQSDSTITEVWIIYKEGSPQKSSFSIPSQWIPSTTAVRNQAPRNGAFNVQIKDSLGKDITSAKVFTVTRDHIKDNPLKLTYTGAAVLEGFFIAQ
jgi:hypothetical protein